MSTILDKIVLHKQKEVLAKKERTSIAKLEKQPAFTKECSSLRDAVLNPQKTGIIAEFKRKSPSKDIINDKAKVDQVTQAYTQNGASGLSVLTDHHFFGGSPEDLQATRKVNAIPILRKDFIIDEYQIIETKAMGADVLLLIAECLTRQTIKSFTQLAQSLGLEVLLELHAPSQLDKIGADNSIIGINNRDLTTFKVDIDRSIELAHQLPKDALKIAESGINDPRVVLKMKKAGFHGFLMGEHFMKEQDPGNAFRKFAQAITLG